MTGFNFLTFQLVADKLEYPGHYKNAKALFGFQTASEKVASGRIIHKNIGRISDLISNKTCYEMIRENQWPDDIVRYPHCNSGHIKKNKKNGHDNFFIYTH